MGSSERKSNASKFWTIFKVFQSLNYIKILDALPGVGTIVSGKDVNGVFYQKLCFDRIWSLVLTN